MEPHVVTHTSLQSSELRSSWWLPRDPKGQHRRWEESQSESL